MLRKIQRAYISIIIVVLLVAITGISFCDCVKEAWFPNSPIDFESGVSYMNMQSKKVMLITAIQMLTYLASGKLFAIISFVSVVARFIVRWIDFFLLDLSTNFGGLGYAEYSLTVWGWIVLILDFVVLVLTLQQLIIEAKDKI